MLMHAEIRSSKVKEFRYKQVSYHGRNAHVPLVQLEPFWRGVGFHFSFAVHIDNVSGGSLIWHNRNQINISRLIDDRLLDVN